MPFPTKKPAGMFDDPADDMGKPAHAEPEGDESMMGDDALMNDLASKDIFGAEGDNADLLGGGSPIETALMDAGIAVTPEQLTQIEAILKPAAKPMPGKIGMKKPAPMGGKPPMLGTKAPGSPLPPPKATGGIVPNGMKPSMLG